MHNAPSAPVVRPCGPIAVPRLALARLALCGLALFPGVACASEGSRVATEYGCINCHGSQSRSAPSFDRLAEQMGRDGDRPEALQHMLREMREHASINTHQMVSDAQALAVLRWLAQGAK